MAQRYLNYLWGLGALVLIIVFLLSLSSAPAPRTRVGEMVDSKAMALMPKNCRKMTVHFFSNACPACQFAAEEIKRLPWEQRRCWLGVEMRGQGSSQKLYGRMIKDDGQMSMDWGVRRIPETFVLQQGKIVAWLSEHKHYQELR